MGNGVVESVRLTNFWERALELLAIDVMVVVPRGGLDCGRILSVSVPSFISGPAGYAIFSEIVPKKLRPVRQPHLAKASRRDLGSAPRLPDSSPIKNCGSTFPGKLMLPLGKFQFPQAYREMRVLTCAQTQQIDNSTPPGAYRVRENPRGWHSSYQRL